jgi:hypothetical protein
MEDKKHCSKCKEDKFLSFFHRNTKASDGHASWCKTCVNGFARQSRKRTYLPENKRKWQLKTRYGLTPEKVETILIKQQHQCVLCLSSLDKFHIDHCHNTGEVRGILCHKCNIRLGGWDDLQWRNKALSYLGIHV